MCVYGEIRQLPWHRDFSVPASVESVTVSCRRHSLETYSLEFQQETLTCDFIKCLKPRSHRPLRRHTTTYDGYISVIAHHRE